MWAAHLEGWACAVRTCWGYQDLGYDADSGECGRWEEEEAVETKEDARRRVLMTMHRLVRAIPAPTKGQAGPNGTGTVARTRPLFRRMFQVLAGVLDAEVKRTNPERFVRERSFNLMRKLFARFQAVGPDCTCYVTPSMLGLVR